MKTPGNLIEKILLWILTAFLAVFALIYFPSLRCFAALLAAALLAPIPQWQDTLGKFMKGNTKTIITILLVILSFVSIPATETATSGIPLTTTASLRNDPAERTQDVTTTGAGSATAAPTTEATAITTAATAEPTTVPTAPPAAAVSTSPNTEPSAKPTTAPTTEPSAPPTTKPAAESAAPSTSGSSSVPTTTPPTESPTEATTKPTTAPTTAPTTEPPTEPTTAPTTKPPAEPTTTPATEPPTEPTTTPATEPPAEATTAPSDGIEQDYVLNKNSKKFHYPNCSSAKQIKDSNRAEYHGTRDDLLTMGYSPCGRCHP